MYVFRKKDGFIHFERSEQARSSQLGVPYCVIPCLLKTMCCSLRQQDVTSIPLLYLFYCISVSTQPSYEP